MFIEITLTPTEKADDFKHMASRSHFLEYIALIEVPSIFDRSDSKTTGSAIINVNLYATFDRLGLNEMSIFFFFLFE